MHASLLGLLALPLAACSAAGPDRAQARSEVTAAEVSRDEGLGALLRRRYPSLRVEETASGLSLRIRQYDHPPLIVIDGTRYPAGATSAIAGLRASEIVDVRVLKTMSETMVYGADAALGGVVEITTTLARDR